MTPLDPDQALARLTAKLDAPQSAYRDPTFCEQAEGVIWDLVNVGLAVVDATDTPDESDADTKLRRISSFMDDPDSPLLGLATNRQLLDEIRARIEIQWDLDYRTVDGGSSGGRRIPTEDDSRHDATPECEWSDLDPDWCNKHARYRSRTSADGAGPTGGSHGERGTVAQETEGDPSTWRRLEIYDEQPESNFYPGPVVGGAPTWGAYLRDVPDNGYEVYRPQPPLIEDIWTPSAETEWAPNAWALIRRTPQPATERVPWHEAVDSRRKAEFAYSDGITDRYATVHSGGWCSLAKTMCVRDFKGNRIRDVESDGTVEVLVENKRRMP